MEILFNGQSVEIGVENEKTLKELAKSVQEWSGERNLIFTGVFADEDYFPAEEIGDITLDALGCVDFQIESKSDLVIGTISEAGAFCDKLLGFIDELPEDMTLFDEVREDILDSLEWLETVTKSVVSLLDLDTKSLKFLDQTLDEYLARLQTLPGTIRDGGGEALIQNRPVFEKLKGLYKMLLFSDSIRSLVISSIDSPDRLVAALVSTREALEVQVANLEKVAALFQSGKDKDAAELFYPFIDFMYAYLRSAVQTQPVFGIDPDSIVVNDISLEQRNNDIHSFLSEIVEVMENDDIISMADILEYEMKPLLAELPAYLDELIKKVNG